MMQTKLLNEDITTQVKEVFAQLKEPVKVIFFGKKDDCEYCDDALQLLTEVVELSDALSLETYDLNDNADVAKRFNMDKAPGFVVAGVDGDQIIDYGVRFLGIPSGHEFSTLIHDFLLISSRESGLSQKTRDFLKNLKTPVHLQVFVTPTCPYCPRAVVLAHQMAMESPLVTAEGVEATEFAELADRFHVSGVPQTTINDGAGTLLGAVPEENLLAEIMRAVSA